MQKLLTLLGMSEHVSKCSIPFSNFISCLLLDWLSQGILLKSTQLSTGEIHGDLYYIILYYTYKV